MSSSTMLMLSPSQRYAAGALFGLALNQAQAHQTSPLGLNNDCPDITVESPSWVHETSGLLRPVFRFLEIDSDSWVGLEETAGSSIAKHHIEAFVKLLSEDATSDMKDHEVALSKAVDSLVQSMEATKSDESKVEKHREYEDEYKDKYSTVDSSNADAANMEMTPGMVSVEDSTNKNGTDKNSMPLKEVSLLSYERKVAVLYQLLSACLSDFPKDDGKTDQKRKGYDARYRVALRLLTTWLDIEWNKMVAIETMIACTTMAIIKGEQSKEGDDSHSPENSWDKWKRGSIIGAAALTGGTLMAITGGLAAPAIASGLGALAPTLGGLVPVIGASGFAAAASAAGTAAGSVAVAASFGAAGAGLTGSKMARRTGDIDEFEFKDIGENQNQGRLAVEILVSGFVFAEEDFLKPWEGLHDEMERYALQWESQNLISVSTAIQDWLTSKVATELMKKGAMMTVMSSLLAALAWPAALLTATDFIDSKWSIALDRSDKTGKLLAETLQKGLQGRRPVTLVGFSLGARAIFKCLQYLAEAEHNAELVERVVLLGAPIAIKGENWEAARKVVAGRFVNVYSANDWMLGVAFRASLLTQGLAGIQPIDTPGIENVDVTDQIEGHSSYLWATQQILDQLQLDSYYPVPKETLIKP